MGKVHAIWVATESEKTIELFSNKKTAIDYALGYIKRYLVEEYGFDIREFIHVQDTEAGLERAISFVNDYTNKQDEFYLAKDGETYLLHFELPFIYYQKITISDTSTLTANVFNLMDDNYMIRERGFNYTKPERR